MPDTSILLGWLQDLNILICILSLNSSISSMVSAPSASGILHARMSSVLPFLLDGFGTYSGERINKTCDALEAGE